MTHIGIINSYYPELGMGVIVDAQKVAHIFTTLPNSSFSSDQFVTYEGEGEIVDDVIALEDYSKFKKYTKQKLSLQWCPIGIIYLVNKKGERYRLYEPECIIVQRAIFNEQLIPSTIDLFSESDFQNEIRRIIESVEYVNKHIQDIANSYSIEIEYGYHSKPGDDDSYGVYGKVKLSYRDCYIDKFFLKDEELYKERSYSISSFYYDRSDSIEAEVKKGKTYFIKNYNKEEHLSALLYELYRKQANIIIGESCTYFTTVNTWKVHIEFYHFLFGNNTSIDALLTDIRIFNKQRSELIGKDEE